MHYWINFVSFNYTEHLRCKIHVLHNINSNLYKSIVKLMQCKIKNLWLIFTKYWCKHVTKWCCTFKCIHKTIYCKQTFIRVQEIFTRFARAMLVQEIFASFTRALTLQITLAINQSLLNGFKKQQNAWRNNLSPQTSLSPVCKIRVVAKKSWFTVVITYQLLLLKTLIQYLSTAISLAIFSLLEPTNK